jgi:hypothetical protein
MNEYNDIWTKEKFLEYRKLKRNGYSHEMLKEHFGEAIYHSGIYNKKSSIMPWLDFITEIKITPEKTSYSIVDKISDIYLNKLDYIVNFEHDNCEYIISLFYYIIGDIETYSLLLTTEKQWVEYLNYMNSLRYKGGNITEEERKELVNIVEKETGLNQLYPVMKKVSYILFDVFENKLNHSIISIGETNNLVKINLYRNIIKNSFSDVEELGLKVDDHNNKYYLYSIK